MIALSLVAHRHGGVVGVQHLRLQHPVLEQLPERRQQLGRRAAIQSHIVERGSLTPEPFETLLGAVQRNVILILVDDDLGQQARSRQPLVERLRRLGGDGDVAFAALAGVLDALVLDDEHLGRLVVVLLGRLARRSRHAAVPHSGQSRSSVGQLVAALFATQLPRRPTPAVRLAFARLVRFRLDGGRRRCCGFRLGQFRKQQRLVRIDRFRWADPGATKHRAAVAIRRWHGDPAAPPSATRQSSASERLCRLGVCWDRMTAGD